MDPESPSAKTGTRFCYSQEDQGGMNIMLVENFH